MAHSIKVHANKAHRYDRSFYTQRIIDEPSDLVLWSIIHPAVRVTELQVAQCVLHAPISQQGKQQIVVSI